MRDGILAAMGNRLSKIYTRTGDDGTTGLATGERVEKWNLRVESYGAVDETNSAIGVARLHADGDPDLAAMLGRIQNDLFDLGADLCVPKQPKEAPGSALRIVAAQVTTLEHAIDRLNERLQTLRTFILPGGSPASAWLHMARTVCRRAERSVVTLQRTETINSQALVYLNRLSDLLFVLARIANDDGKADVLWIPGASRPKM